MIDKDFAFLAVWLFLIIVLVVSTIYAIGTPIDEGGEVSRLATAGIMRNADV